MNLLEKSHLSRVNELVFLLDYHKRFGKNTCFVSSLNVSFSWIRFSSQKTLFALFRDVGDGGRNFSGALEAAVVGKWDSVLPRVHDWIWAPSTDNAAYIPGARSRPTRTHASASHLCDGKLWTPTSNVAVVTCCVSTGVLTAGERAAIQFYSKMKQSLFPLSWYKRHLTLTSNLSVIYSSLRNTLYFLLIHILSMCVSNSEEAECRH